MQLLGRQTWETIGKMKAHLMSKHADGARTSAVFFLHTFGKHPI
jgi:hypothetical protein